MHLTTVQNKYWGKGAVGKGGKEMINPNQVKVKMPGETPLLCIFVLQGCRCK